MRTYPAQARIRINLTLSHPDHPDKIIGERTIGSPGHEGAQQASVTVAEDGKTSLHLEGQVYPIAPEVGVQLQQLADIVDRGAEGSTTQDETIRTGETVVVKLQPAQEGT